MFPSVADITTHYYTFVTSPRNVLSCHGFLFLDLASNRHTPRSEDLARITPLGRRRLSQEMRRLHCAALYEPPCLLVAPSPISGHLEASKLPPIGDVKLLRRDLLLNPSRCCFLCCSRLHSLSLSLSRARLLFAFCCALIPVPCCNATVASLTSNTLLTNWARIDPALKDRLQAQPTDHSNHISHQQYTDPSIASQQFAHSAPRSNGVSGQPGAQVLPAPAHGYTGNQIGEQDAHIHPELRSLRDSNPGQDPGHAAATNMMQAGVPPHSEGGGGVMAGPPHPSSSVSPSMESADMGDVVMADGRKAKRELSQSKRAAQNRAAQVSQVFSLSYQSTLSRNCDCTGDC